ncbi:sigma-70 family RNA polymerase sigma factor [Actinomadura sp. HBU206391]|nr:sigma-70 family RNA polymerase sigma factor [Actinomadura sp. HBU206391]
MYNDNYRRVLAYALTKAEPHAAEDLASEAFLIAWRRLDDVPAQALPWLLGVVRNLLHKQRDGDHRRSALTERIAALTAAESTTWDVAEHVIERESALAAVATLPEQDLEVLTLVTWHGLTPKEAAKVLGCSATAFFVRLHRARRRLAKALDAAPPPPHSARTFSPVPKATR